VDIPNDLTIFDGDVCKVDYNTLRS